MRLEDLMERAAQYDETLARDIKDYVHGRKYGLVYEASKPEFVRMWNKPVVRGDLVNILPPRGVMEDTKSEDDPHETVYKVIGLADGTATLRNIETGELADAAVEDVVAIARFDKPIYAGLKETGRVERGGDKPYHVVINGENYHALQTLLYAYQGKVDCIYIDPPYNSGAKDWKYNNNYVGEEDQYRHSKWLTFIEDRLKLAKKLLNPKDSVLILTIDEKEYLRVGLLLEQMFPEAKIQMVSSVINPAGVSRGGEFSRTDEYLYFVFIGGARPRRMVLSKEWRGQIKGGYKGRLRWNGLQRSGTSVLRTDRPNMFYPIFVDEKTMQIVEVGESIGLNVDRKSVKDRPGLITVWPIFPDGREGRWRLGQNSLTKYLAQGYVKVGKNRGEQTAISYLAKGEQEKIHAGEFDVLGYSDQGYVLVDEDNHEAKFIPGTQWWIQSHDATQNGTKVLSALLPGRNFPFPKSVYAVEDALRFFVSHNPDALIVDFFSGSGTTANAVMRLNRQDNGRRCCISITNNEVSEEEAKRFTKRELRQGDEEWERYGIAQYITWPRIKAAITGVTPDGEPIKGEYGIKTDEYQEVEGDVLEPETGKKMRGKFFKKIQVQSKSVPDPFPMRDGFEENAIFFELEYLEPSIVSADLAFNRIAPILWLCGGCEGEILTRQDGYVIGETYAVLFDPTSTGEFVEAVDNDNRITTAFIVTDSAERYRSLCMRLPKVNVKQLYESYLRSFEINAIG